MRSFKLIQMYPGTMECMHLNDIVEQQPDKESYWCYAKNYSISKDRVENWPEFWQEVKQPLFKTHDEVEIFDYNTELWWIAFSNYTSFSINDNRQIGVVNGVSTHVFSTKEAAEKWIDENKPVFSKKMVRDIIYKSKVEFQIFGFSRSIGLIEKELGL
jgi:hypothetical protein